MIRSAVIAAIVACLSSWLPAAQPAVVELVEPSADNPWLGQRLDFAVEVAVEGRFDGATVFDLPELPGAILFKPEQRPVLSSKRIDGREFVVQRHGFTLFCQRPGELTVNGMAVRCGSIAGVGAEPVAHRLELPAFTIHPRQQPDLSPGQVVVTSSRFEVEERWDSQPGEAKPGDAFRRSVTIIADDVPGMLLPPLPHAGFDGLAIYPAAPSIDDRTERGAFTGRRSDSVTYLCEAAGEFELPMVRYRCWDPGKEEWIIRELPAAAISVAGPLVPESQVADGPGTRWGRIISVLLILLAGVAVAIFLRRSHDTPEADAFREFRDACGSGSPARAVHAFHRWGAIALPGKQGTDLQAALRAAEEAIVGERSGWTGRDLLQAAGGLRRRRPIPRVPARHRLDSLNP